MANWKSRITGQGEMPPSELLPNPRNFRTHPLFQKQALGDQLEQLGWIQQVIVNKVTGRLLDGHLRVALALEKGQRRVPVVYVELSETEEALALATLDPLTALAVTDGSKLNELLQQVATQTGQLGDFLSELQGQAEAVQLKDHSPNAMKTAKGAVAHWVKVVVAVGEGELEAVEQAIASVGTMNRAHALVTICRSYLESQKRQQRGEPEGEPEAPSAQDAFGTHHDAGDARGLRPPVASRVPGRRARSRVRA